MSTDTRTSVMLVDDHQVMRDLLRDALENTGEFQVVAQAADGQEALRLVVEAAPDVIVMDVIMPVMDGIDACRQIMELLPGTRVLMLTASNEQDAIVRSYRRRSHRVPAGSTPAKEQLLTTLREVALGEFRIPGDAARRLARAVRSPSADDAAERLGTLTEREREILKLFAGGLSYQEIERGEGGQPADGAQPRCRACRGSWGSGPGSRWCSGRCAPAWWTAAPGVS